VSKKANLFVVGAMKAGTTSFVDMLSKSKEIYIPPIKEPHYFVNELPQSIYNPSRFFDLNTYFEKEFPKPIHIAKLNKSNHYDKLYSLAQPQHKYLVDASTCYLNSPESAKQIYKYNENAIIIILLRDPLKRAISHYQMDVGLGRTLRSFEDEISNDIRDYKKGRLSQWSYLNMSFYNQQVDSFRDYFEDRLLILNLEKLIKSDKEEFVKLHQFLGIESSNNLPEQNKTRKIKFQYLSHVLIKIGFKDFFSFLVPAKLKHKLFQILSSEGKQEINLSEKKLKKLQSLFGVKSNKYLL
jgi:hypothetical protein